MVLLLQILLSLKPNLYSEHLLQMELILFALHHKTTTPNKAENEVNWYFGYKMNKNTWNLGYWAMINTHPKRLEMSILTKWLFLIRDTKERKQSIEFQKLKIISIITLEPWCPYFHCNAGLNISAAIIKTRTSCPRNSTNLWKSFYPGSETIFRWT